MVTAELAACLPVLVLVLGIALAAVAVVAAHVRVLDAAREAARAAGRGDVAAARRLVGEAAPGAHLQLAVGAATVRAVVEKQVRPLGGWLPAITVREQAVAEVEPTPAGGAAAGP